MYYPHIKELALKMRKQGASLGDIASKLNVSKSTLSFWCKDISLSDNLIEKIQTKGRAKSMRGLFQYAEKKRKERMDKKSEQKRLGANMVTNLSQRDMLMLGLGLYWGEGYKYENGEFGFTNSNPEMIRFYFRWLELWHIKKENLIFRITLNEFFRKEEKSIKLFWVNFLSIQESQFSKTTFIKTVLKKGSMENLKDYKGILRVKVRKGSDIRNRIIGAIEHIAKQ